MSSKFLILVIFIFFINLNKSISAIYGLDNLKNPLNIPQNLKKYLKYSKSTAAMVHKSLIKFSNGGKPIIDISKLTPLKSVPELSSRYPNKYLCDHSRFADELVVSSCTAFLISSDLLITAAHCIKSNVWKNFYWIFELTNEALHSPLGYNQIFESKKIEEFIYDKNNKKDFAILRLNALVDINKRPPFKLRKRGNLKISEGLVSIGYPLGRPLKIVDGGVVKENVLFLPYFLTNLDSLRGNSGAPVLNAKTLKVEGVISQGGQSLIYNRSKDCLEYKELSEKQGLERTMRITDYLKTIKLVLKK